MKNYIQLLTAFVAGCALLASCATREDEFSGNAKEIKFTASVGSFQVKATDTAFEAADAVGLSTYQSQTQIDNARLVWNGNALEAETPVYWNAQQPVNEESIFIATYPYAEGRNNLDFEFSVNADQSTHALYTASDLMWSEASATPADGTVHLNFVHKLSKIILQIDNKLDNTEIAEVYMGNVRGRANVRSGIPAATGDYGTIKAAKVTLADGSPAWALIIVPQYTQMHLMITTTEGKQYNYDMPYGVSFTGGHRYNANIVIDETSFFSDFTSDVIDWVDDNDIQFGQSLPTNGEWSLIGTLYGSNWDTDFPMLRYTYEYDESNPCFYSAIYAREGDQFKLRYDGSWDVNLGINANSALGYYPAVKDGPNINLPGEGLYEVLLFPKDGAIYIDRASQYSWSVIGDIEGTYWDTDFNLEPTFVEKDGVKYPAFSKELTLYANQEFKLRFMQQWPLNFGGASSTSPLKMYTSNWYALARDGVNLTVAQDGTYWIIFDIFHQEILPVLTGDVPGDSVINANSISEVLYGQDGNTYRVHGEVSSILNTTYGNYFISDYSGGSGENVWTGFSNVETWFTGADWSGGLDPNLQVNGNGEITLTIPAGIGGDEWQGQVHLKGLQSIYTNQPYIFSCHIESSNNGIASIALRVDNTSGEAIFYDGRVNIQASTDINIGPVYSPENTVPSLSFDFGRMPAGTQIKISDIQILSIGAGQEKTDLYIYGTTDGFGNYPGAVEYGWMNDSFGLVLGDIISVSGPKTTYNGTPELVNVTIEDWLYRAPVGFVFNQGTIPGAGGTAQFIVRSDSYPEVVTDADWIYGYAEEAAKSGWYYVYVSADANPNADARMANFSVYSDNYSAEAYVSQSPAPISSDQLQPIVDTADNTQVEFNAIVHAVCTRGFVAYDGKYAIYVYTGANNMNCRIGDLVHVSGTKTTYNGVAEISNSGLSYEVVSSGNDLFEIFYNDITAFPEQFDAFFPIGIQFEGTLARSGNYYNVTLDSGTITGSINYPVSELGVDDLDGQRIIVKGFYNGKSGGGSYLNIIATQVSPATAFFVDDQTGWDDITLYMWGDVNDLGGRWPGIWPNREITIDNVDYKVFTVENARGLNENLIFNNGGFNIQLEDYSLTLDANEYFLRVTPNGVEAL